VKPAAVPYRRTDDHACSDGIAGGDGHRIVRRGAGEAEAQIGHGDVIGRIAVAVRVDDPLESRNDVGLFPLSVRVEDLVREQRCLGCDAVSPAPFAAMMPATCVP
jgi:hypothetical protein